MKWPELHRLHFCFQDLLNHHPNVPKEPFTCTNPVRSHSCGRRSAAPLPRLWCPDEPGETPAEPGSLLSSPRWWEPGAASCSPPRADWVYLQTSATLSWRRLNPEAAGWETPRASPRPAPRAHPRGPARSAGRLRSSSAPTQRSIRTPAF